MTRTLFPTGTLNLVCDGSKALVFENMGDDRNLNLNALDVRVEPHLPNREFGSDRPTRVFDSMDGSRSGTQETDWHAEAEARFLGDTAHLLDRLVRERHAKHVAVIAPPRALGMLRDALSPTTRAVLFTDVAKDWVKLPTNEIERQLTAMGELQ
ncbi:host attachment protein [Devosia nitrariae]|uniref:Protein required for attachment to host cells n=1 Tax=Devosia nitrariae TaxID=2071872 RepID=A0ABQ5W9T1_9HYPH|nr:host attachment protein [Devosia nitrariae]GLQ56584.1 hypothetical protein GCM10010862_38430 [Devosia nitrariae]